MMLINGFVNQREVEDWLRLNNILLQMIVKAALEKQKRKLLPKLLILFPSRVTKVLQHWRVGLGWFDSASSNTTNDVIDQKKLLTISVLMRMFYSTTCIDICPSIDIHWDGSSMSLYCREAIVGVIVYSLWKGSQFCTTSMCAEWVAMDSATKYSVHLKTGHTHLHIITIKTGLSSRQQWRYSRVPDTILQCWSIMTLRTVDLLEAEHQACTEELKFMTQLLYGNDSGWFEQKHMHLFHVCAHDLEIQACLENWAGMDKENKCLMKILCCGSLYQNLLKHDGILSKCYNAFGRDQFCQIMCNSFACHQDTWLPQKAVWHRSHCWNCWLSKNDVQ
jgi:hypothetical protein